jgi:lipopolysaccharide/colanic/teichoic acid biosynthesis glycosyltransferase
MAISQKTLLSRKQRPTKTQHIAQVLKTKRWYESVKYPIISGEPYLRLKRIIDLCLGSILFILFLPVLLLCMLAVYIDSGRPVFFMQERTGYGGKRFKMFKLRTMHQNAEELKQKLLHLNTLKYPDFKIPNDPRITRVGKILRKTSLDELPQILNVLKNDMSLVGPRPTSFHPSTYKLWQTVRLEIKPGITGLWQVLGRGHMEFDDRIRLDYAYMKNVSLGLDILIILRTFTSMLRQEGK